MEHRLILGGEWCLPFARTRVAELKKLGRPYASQSFIVGGVTVSIRITPGHEYIRLEGGGETILRMDSGVVDLITWFGTEPTRYNPGTLHETTGVAEYHTPFLPDGDWRSKPSETSVGQIAGKLTLTKKNVFKGKVPYNTQHAASFKPGTIPDTSTEPAGWIPDPADDRLVAKKSIADYCPPSIFTGKTRLYVQALYGAPLYDEDKKDDEGNITVAGEPVASIVSYDEGIGGTPSIKLDPYRTRGDTAEYTPVVLTTGAGVFLDPVTGKHWLFGTGGDGVSVYNLKGTPEAEKLRRLLKTPPAGKPVLDATDKERLEAYILSTCRPDVKNATYLPFSESTNTWSLGYSWHWNWTGLTADIVNNEEFFQERVLLVDYYAMRSTHRRLTITPTQLEGKTEFSLAVEVVEGPKDWAVERVLWCIAEPQWSNGALLKATPKYTKMIPGDAPFYAFYVRDSLKVCRVKVTATGTNSTRETSPGFGDSMVTAGTDSGFGETRSFSGTYYSATFTCGSKTVTDLHVYRSESGTRDEVSAKTPGEIVWGTVDTPRAAGTNYNYGHPTDAGFPLLYTYTTTTGNCSLWNNRLIPMTYSVTSSVTSIAYPGRATMVVPFKDAEAFYLEGYSERVTNYTGKTQDNLSGGLFGQRSQIQESDYFTLAPIGSPIYPPDYYTYGTAYGGASILSTTNPADTTETLVLCSESVVISHAGITPAIFTNDLFFNRFHDFAYDEVPSNFKTLSGTSVISPVVISDLYIDPAIGTSVVPGMPALVGWV